MRKDSPMLDKLVPCDHIPMRLIGLFVENGVLFALITVASGAKFLPCDPSDLLDAESFELRAREYFGAAYRIDGEFLPAVADAIRKGVAA